MSSRDATCRVEREASNSLPPEIPDELLPSADTQRQAYEQALDRARALPNETLKRLTVESRLAYVNALDGHAQIAPHLDEARALRGVDIEAIAGAPVFAAALLYAERKLSIIVPIKNDFAQRMQRGRQLRQLFLRQAQAAAVIGLVPEEAVERIYAGRGAIDAVEDIVALVALFRRHDDVLAGRTLASPELLDEGERLAAGLQAELRPVSAKTKSKTIDEELAEATDIRNRMWTLLHGSYAELQRVAAFLGVANVPALQSRKALKKKTRTSS